MTPDTSLAIYSELSFLRKDGWDIVRDADRYRIVARSGTLDPSKRQHQLRDEAWRIAQFVAYSHFVSLAQNNDGSFSIVSRMASGDGFEIVVEAAS